MMQVNLNRFSGVGKSLQSKKNGIIIGSFNSKADRHLKACQNIKKNEQIWAIFKTNWLRIKY